MHRLAQHVFGEAEFGSVFAIPQLAWHGEGRIDPALFGEKLQRRQTPPAGDDSEFALAVLAHDERLQKSVRGNRRGKFLQAGVGCGCPADVVL
jgi:hypothetical protein